VTDSYEKYNEFSGSTKGIKSAERVFNLSRGIMLPEVSKFSILYSFRIQQEWNLFLKTHLQKKKTNTMV
jgi:hypothetical protein